jgi:hypothetical protein
MPGRPQFQLGVDLLRVWQVSDGPNVGFVTYACESGREGGELRDCERIVRSLEFREDGGAVNKSPEWARLRRAAELVQTEQCFPSPFPRCVPVPFSQPRGHPFGRVRLHISVLVGLIGTATGACVGWLIEALRR